jgi:hypothetical protein
VRVEYPVFRELRKVGREVGVKGRKRTRGKEAEDESEKEEE